MGFFSGILDSVKDALPVLGPIGGFVGGILGNQSREGIASEANQFSAAMSQQQMDFQERMRNTQWQAGVKDMEAAGLNPMLAYSQGGAASPAGASATGQQYQYENPFQAALSSAGMFAQLDKVAADIDLTRAQAETERNRPDNIRAQTESERARPGNIEAQTRNLDAQTQERLARLNQLLPEEVRNMNADTLRKLSEVNLNVSRNISEPVYRALARIDIALRSNQVKSEAARRELIDTQDKLMRLAMPRAVNEANVETSSSWKQYVAPFLRDFTQGSSGAVNVRRMFE